FAIATTEVTVRQFHAHMKGHKVDETVATTPDSPVNLVSWYQAAEYCNRLSDEAHIPKEEWCYRPNKDGRLDFAPNYLSLQGYRLPTECEWEFACRAGAETAWAFGQADEELTAKYDWFFANSLMSGMRRTHPVAFLKPNDWGLFDMHGNVSEWCQEARVPEPREIADDIWCAGKGGNFRSDCSSMGWKKSAQFGRKYQAPW